jgi:hypothetical protein
MEKYIVTIVLSFLMLSEISAQEDSLSYDYCRDDSSKILYRYNNTSQTHSYSWNWDFDGDKIPDSVFFVGNGGAHVFYQLTIGLSSGSHIKDFPKLSIDLPCLGKVEDIIEEPTALPQFVVHDFDSDGVYDIYLHYDPSFSSIQKKWRSKGVTSRQIIIRLKDKKLVIEPWKR